MENFNFNLGKVKIKANSYCDTNDKNLNIRKIFNFVAMFVVEMPGIK